MAWSSIFEDVTNKSETPILQPQLSPVPFRLQDIAHQKTTPPPRHLPPSPVRIHLVGQRPVGLIDPATGKEVTTAHHYMNPQVRKDLFGEADEIDPVYEKFGDAEGAVRVDDRSQQIAAFLSSIVPTSEGDELLKRFNACRINEGGRTYAPGCTFTMKNRAEGDKLNLTSEDRRAIISGSRGDVPNEKPKIAYKKVTLFERLVETILAMWNLVPLREQPDTQHDEHPQSQGDSKAQQTSVAPIDRPIYPEREFALDVLSLLSIRLVFASEVTRDIKLACKQPNGTLCMTDGVRFFHDTLSRDGQRVIHENRVVGFERIHTRFKIVSLRYALWRFETARADYLATRNEESLVEFISKCTNAIKKHTALVIVQAFVECLAIPPIEWMGHVISKYLQTPGNKMMPPTRVRRLYFNESKLSSLAHVKLIKLCKFLAACESSDVCIECGHVTRDMGLWTVNQIYLYEIIQAKTAEDITEAKEQSTVTADHAEKKKLQRLKRNADAFNNFDTSVAPSASLIQELEGVYTAAWTRAILDRKAVVTGYADDEEIQKRIAKKSKPSKWFDDLSSHFINMSMSKEEYDKLVSAEPEAENGLARAHSVHQPAIAHAATACTLLYLKHRHWIPDVQALNRRKLFTAAKRNGNSEECDTVGVTVVHGQRRFVKLCEECSWFPLPDEHGAGRQMSVRRQAFVQRCLVILRLFPKRDNPQRSTVGIRLVRILMQSFDSPYVLLLANPVGTSHTSMKGILHDVSCFFKARPAPLREGAKQVYKFAGLQGISAPAALQHEADVVGRAGPATKIQQADGEQFVDYDEEEKQRGIGVGSGCACMQFPKVVRYPDDTMLKSAVQAATKQFYEDETWTPVDITSFPFAYYHNVARKAYREQIIYNDHNNHCQRVILAMEAHWCEEIRTKVATEAKRFVESWVAHAASALSSHSADCGFCLAKCDTYSSWAKTSVIATCLVVFREMAAIFAKMPDTPKTSVPVNFSIGLIPGLVWKEARRVYVDVMSQNITKLTTAGTATGVIDALQSVTTTIGAQANTLRQLSAPLASETVKRMVAYWYQCKRQYPPPLPRQRKHETSPHPPPSVPGIFIAYAAWVEDETEKSAKAAQQRHSDALRLVSGAVSPQSVSPTGSASIPEKQTLKRRHASIADAILQINPLPETNKRPCNRDLVPYLAACLDGVLPVVLVPLVAEYAMRMFSRDLDLN